ncbi:alpha/beta hydrolase [Streptomyces indicus]|uniref:alpha/beta hydrolase n=1 Tax=Streptomyces indicus TaxID=417292 RepID=UPI001C4093CB|nr:alpha/beta hydrolase-fold protein [Streptomyces indicus]
MTVLATAAGPEPAAAGPMSVAASPLDWSLVDGTLPVVLRVLGLASLAFLLITRDRRWWTRWLPAALVLAALLTFLVKVIVNDWWQPFPDELPFEVLFWIGILLLALLLALFKLRFLRWRGRVGALFAALCVVLYASNQVNIYYDNFPTVRTMLGPQDTVSLKDATGTKEPVLEVPPGRTIEDVWRPPKDLPAKGTVSQTPIPGTKSGFKAQTAYVYLPPAYRASPRPLLPVLVLLPGQPGAPENWITSGELPTMMDAFAAEHRGLAPIVVVADNLGSPFDNPLCVDGKLGKVQTYLSEDVPNWVAAHLQAATDRAQWAISGLSNGGTCSLQTAVNAPQRYGRFIDISGEAEPSVGSHQQTVDSVFGGDEAAFRKVNPLDVMARQKFPDTAGVFVAGTEDSTYRPQAKVVYDAARKAGMDVRLMELPGAHNWSVWRPGLEKNLPWLARQTRLIP